jgi:pimeloyl-ACP methyl ester carboxylesterase
VNPRTRYARRDAAAIAYQTHGEGPVDLVFLAGVISHIGHLWEDPALARLFDRQAEFSRLILMDRRGTGLSDPLSGPLVLEEEVDDLAAVLDAVGSRHLHTGECERMGDDIGAHIAARVAGRAAPREVLASGTTYGTVVGSGLHWQDRGMQVLKGVPGYWPLFALEREPD